VFAAEALRMGFKARAEGRLNAICDVCDFSAAVAGNTVTVTPTSNDRNATNHLS
jgi:hypothetical protein